MNLLLPKLKSCISMSFYLWMACASAMAQAATLSDPEVERYNVRVGTQTFSGLYNFTTNTLLVETAEAIRAMGSDILKFHMAQDYDKKYRITLPSNVTNLVTLARDEPSCRRVLDMPFRHYIVWVYPFAYWWPFDGYSPPERNSEYAEVYDLTCYVLTNYNDSGKTFYFGHWEGDGYLTLGDWTSNPTDTMVQGFIDCLNNRQKAVDDAKAATPHTNVDVFCYAEVNRVRDAMIGYRRMINSVIPALTNLDYLSYSAYDAQNLSLSTLTATLDYVESWLPTNKVRVIPGERLFIGEYGFANSGRTPAEQEAPTRQFIQRMLNYGTKGVPFILFWEIYNNEPNHYFCLVDSNNVKVASWHTHQRFINNARLLTAQFKEHHGRLPNDTEFVSLVSPMLDQPLPEPVALALSSGVATLLTPTSAKLTSVLTQGVYGDDLADVYVFYGQQDGGTALQAWENTLHLGLNTNFNPTTFSGVATNLAPNGDFFFRFYATNANGSSWMPASSRFSTRTLDPADYTSRMRITFSGYDRNEVLTDFPVLVNLSTNLLGFDYRQFASFVGGDLRFTDSSGLHLIPHEIDEWHRNGTSKVWVRLPEVSGASNYIWAYWGFSGQTSVNGAEVWSSGYRLVWHLKEGSSPFSDSAQNHPGISSHPPGPIPGVIGGAGSFDGVSRFIDAGVVQVGDAFSLSAWINLDPSASNIQTIWANKPGGWNADGFALFVNSYNTSDRKLLLETGNGTEGFTASTGPDVIAPGQWHHITAAIDRAGGRARLYVDGRERTQAGRVQTTFSTENAVTLGRFADDNFHFKGILDEVRIESGMRSSDWVWASWMNVASNATFTTCSPVNPRPSLALNLNQNNCLLTWPANAGPFQLFTATNLAPPIHWERLPAAPDLLNGFWNVHLPASGDEMRFFQLGQ